MIAFSLGCETSLCWRRHFAIMLMFSRARAPTIKLPDNIVNNLMRTAALTFLIDCDRRFTLKCISQSIYTLRLMLCVAITM